MKIPSSVKTPTLLRILTVCIASLVCVCLVLAFTIGTSVTSQTIAWMTWVVIITGIFSIFLLFFLLLLIIKHAHSCEKDMIDRINTIKTMFFQDMSHEFKTPLTVISVNILDIVHMLDYEINKNEIKENLDNAQNEVMRMSRMVDSTVNDAIGQDIRYDMDFLNISKLLREGVEPYRSLLKRNNNTLVSDIPKHLPKIYGNADMILLVLANLLSNANKYTSDGTITVSAETDKKSIIVSVSDTGSGIDPKILPTVFNRGVSDSGSGLGLPICKSAVDAHKGKINIESILNKGTTVCFTIPIKTN